MQQCSETECWYMTREWGSNFTSELPTVEILLNALLKGRACSGWKCIVCVWLSLVILLFILPLFLSLCFQDIMWPTLFLHILLIVLQTSTQATESTEYSLKASNWAKRILTPLFLSVISSYRWTSEWAYFFSSLSHGISSLSVCSVIQITAVLQLWRFSSYYIPLSSTYGLLLLLLFVLELSL